MDLLIAFSRIRTPSTIHRLFFLSIYLSMVIRLIISFDFYTFCDKQFWYTFGDKQLIFINKFDFKYYHKRNYVFEKIITALPQISKTLCTIFTHAQYY